MNTPTSSSSTPTTSPLESHVRYLEGLLRDNDIDFKKYQPKSAFKRQQSKTEVYFESNIEDKLDYDDIERYKRQMLLKEINMEGQVKMKHAKVLVVGAGGIGGPAALYLAGAGIGTIGLIDGDTVEVSNLHRQIIHTTERVGMNKCLSAQTQIQQFNPSVNVITHQFNLTPENCTEIFESYDIILDATDNPQTRYLINDACVIMKKPLVSGSAVGWEGQLSVFSHQDGPCYRCLFPECPKGVKNCSEAGVFGVLPGVIGLLEVLEAVKIIIGKGQPLTQKMLLVDGLEGNIKVAKLRFKQKDCAVCGEKPDILNVTEFDYKSFTATCSTIIGPPKNYTNISWQEMSLVIETQDCVLIDCRPREQFQILNFQKFTHLPWVEFKLLEDDEVKDKLKIQPQNEKNVYIMCRSGNQSRMMCDFLHAKGYTRLHNVVGGMNLYAKDYDPDMPLL